MILLNHLINDLSLLKHESIRLVILVHIISIKSKFILHIIYSYNYLIHEFHWGYVLGLVVNVKNPRITLIMKFTLIGMCLLRYLQNMKNICAVHHSTVNK